MVYQKYGQKFNLPEVVTFFSGDLDTLKNGLQSLSISLSDYDPGFMLVDNYSGSHAKYRNPKYKDLLELKGHYPISLHEKNKYNLFKLWWRLRKDNTINKFLSIFENEKGEYRQLFTSFYKLVVKLTNDLFMTYQGAFVKRLMLKQNIPYIYKPLCGDLHKLYLKKGAGIMLHDVINYVNSSSPSKIYWRLYYEEQDTVPEAENMVESEDK